MSGGHFDYNQRHIEDIADSLEEYITGHELHEEDVEEYIHDTLYFWDETDKKKAADYIRLHRHTLPNQYDYSKATLAEFHKGLYLLRRAFIFAQRIDWLISGDDGEESFHQRLKEDLEKLKKQQTKNYGSKRL